MWVFEVSSGWLSRNNLRYGQGYSGARDGKDNPLFQSIHNVGPIPEGLWIIGEPHDSATHGPFCLPLTPEPETNTYGRSGFLIHGDSIAHPGKASEGCIILPHDVRMTVWNSKDRLLKVVASLTDDTNWSAT